LSTRWYRDFACDVRLAKIGYLPSKTCENDISYRFLDFRFLKKAPQKLHSKSFGNNFKSHLAETRFVPKKEKHSKLECFSAIQLFRLSCCCRAPS